MLISWKWGLLYSVDFSLNKQRHNHIYPSLSTPSSHTFCERCDSYFLFISFYPLSTCLCWINIKDRSTNHVRWIPSLPELSISYDLPQPCSFLLGCKLQTFCTQTACLEWYLAQTSYQTMPGTGLGSSYCIQNNQIPKAAVLDISSACIQTSDIEDLSDLSLGSFPEEITSSFLLQSLPPGPECIPQDRLMQIFLFIFPLLTTACLSVYITYCIYACSPFTKGEKEPPQVLVVSNKYCLKPIHRPQKVKLDYLESSFRLNGDYNCLSNTFILFSEAAFYS